MYSYSPILSFHSRSSLHGLELRRYYWFLIWFPLLILLRISCKLTTASLPPRLRQGRVKERERDDDSAWAGVRDPKPRPTQLPRKYPYAKRVNAAQGTKRFLRVPWVFIGCSLPSLVSNLHFLRSGACGSIPYGGPACAWE